MNIEELNKHQLILLTLLVSFVTSIATGIVTVTLLDQAPQDITRTINRVVERTVERVVPGGIETIIKEVPVIVTEEDLVLKVIKSASGAVVKVVDTNDQVNKKSLSGFVLGENGTIITSLSESIEKPRKEGYQISFETGESFPAEFVKKSTSGNISVLKIKSDKLEEFNKLLTTTKGLKLSTKDTIVGQTVVGIGVTNSGSQTVSVSIISSVSGTSTSATVPLLKSNAATPDNVGGPLLDIHGEVVGVSIASGSAISKATLKNLIDSSN